MARQIEGINGGFCGRVGTVIGYQWRGKWCMRAYPRHIRDARSESQLRQREWFKRAVVLASRLKGVLRVGMRERSRRLHLTEGNYFIALNKECFGLEAGRLRVDYGRLALSDGAVAPVAFGEPKLTVTEHAFTVAVDYSSNPLGLPAGGDDEVYLVALCEEEGTAVTAAPAYRRTGHIKMTLPACWEGKRVHLYGFVRDYTGETSASAYLGCVVLLNGGGNLGGEGREFLLRHRDVMAKVKVTRLVEGHKVDVDVGHVDAHHGLADLDARADLLQPLGDTLCEEV